MLSWYNVPKDLGLRLCSLMHSQFENGSQEIQMGLCSMTNGMCQKIHEISFMKEDIKQNSQSATHYRRLYEEKQEENERLTIEAQSVHQLQVIDIFFYLC